jgi:DNA invertase Pin-like site-specific DNA recombinase
MFRVALYARYSSDQQREASIEDQLRLSRLYAEKQGWVAAESYHDRAVSGASLIRPGIQALLTDALRGRFEVVVAEASIASAAIRRMSPAYSSACRSRV